MVHLSILALALSFGLINALPTLHQSTNHTVAFVTRQVCPELTELPIHWDLNADPQPVVKVTFSESLTTRLWCSYSLDEEWNGKKAYVRIPRPMLDEEETELYSEYVNIWRKLDKVLAERQVNDMSVVVMDAYEFRGKKIWETSKWRNFFGKDTRAPLSIYAYGDCDDMLQHAYNAVVEKAIRYAEDKGLKYKMSQFDFEESVRFSDDLEEMDFVNWEPRLVGDEPLPEEYEAVRQGGPDNDKIDMATRIYWENLLTNSDIRISEWSPWYFSRRTGARMDVRGWCLYFLTARKNDDAGHPYAFYYGRDDPATTHIKPHRDVDEASL